MKIEDYPSQEPLSALGAKYHERVLAAGQGIESEDFSYGADAYQALAVFRAAQPSGDVLVFFHGGGWTNGYKEWMAFMAPALTAQGVTFVSAGYRLAPEHVFPVAFEDCADAVAWVARQIGEHGGNAQRIFVGGHSAGGHYAALLAVTSAWRAQRALRGNVLRGCLPVSGVYRFGSDSGMTVRPRFLGPAQDGKAELAASPIEQLEPSACLPFFITHGGRDFPHLIRQAQQMAQALRDAGATVATEILDDCDHFEASLACGDTGKPWAQRAVSWMRQTGV